MVVPSKINNCIRKKCEVFDKEPIMLKLMVLLGGMCSGVLISSLIVGLSKLGNACVTCCKSKNLD
jgi:hypothetical protein